MLFDEEMMLLALAEAQKAYDIGEIPVGAVIVDDEEKIISKGYNRRERDNSPVAHAEIIAIEKAAYFKKNWRLNDCTLYVTLEPCPMCAGAISNARIKRVVYGAFDEKGGALSSLFNLYELPLNHAPMVRSRVLERECGEILSKFFKNLRS
ncbi:MAG: tRNA adenosine(34) deaminase TadA [Eubacterium sp.]|jgi:tRNA(adenine34) deaminase|nr:tRNA adenosine(34) deaminase TadA [Eubacterium sp.]